MEKQKDEACISLKNRSVLMWILFATSLMLAIIVFLITSRDKGHDTSQVGLDEVPSHGKPNILFIMLDDLGFNDVSWNNPMVHMPNLDKLAREGVILDRSYAHTVCSPSRAELLTGKYAHRVGIKHWVITPTEKNYLRLQERTLAQELKAIGYSTNLIGKWHLGFCREEAWPTRRGFDTFYGSPAPALDSYTHCHSGIFRNDTAFDWWDNGILDTTGQGIHVTDLVKLRTKSIIKESDGSKPLFILMAPFAPHVPVQSPLKFARLYENLTHPWRQQYLGMVTHVDEAVGEVIQSLKNKGIYNNTIIVFSSDNGGEPGPSSNAPLRGAKLSTYEGGQRVPAFISGPGLKKRRYVNTERFHMTDWLPTLMKLAGSQDFNISDLDGIDQSDMLINGGPTKRREIVYRIDTEEPVTFGYATISYDNYKLIERSPGFSDGWEQDGTVGIIGPGGEIFPVRHQLIWSKVTSDRCPLTKTLPYNFTLSGLSSQYGATLTDALALYDIEADPEERQNLAALMPEKVSELQQRLMRHKAQELTIPIGLPYPVEVTQQDNAWHNRWCEDL